MLIRKGRGFWSLALLCCLHSDFLGREWIHRTARLKRVSSPGCPLPTAAKFFFSIPATALFFIRQIYANVIDTLRSGSNGPVGYVPFQFR